MNLHLLYKGYTVKNSDMPIMSEWREYHLLAQTYGCTPTEIRDNMDDAEISMSLAILIAENEARRK